jgi:hypothetical protein
VGRARRFLRAILSASDPSNPPAASSPPDPVAPVDGDLLDLLLITANELTTNAVLHGRTDFTVRVVRSTTRTRIEVTDANPRMPQPCLAPLEAASGRGLAILEASGLDWGIERHSEGKTVWVEAATNGHQGPG